MKYLSVKYIIELQNSLQNTAGGLVNIAGLESVVFSIQQGYYNNNIIESAAALWRGLIINHAFLDGNKRTGTLVMLEFLKINNIKIYFDNEELADFAVNVAMGKYTFEEIIEIIKNNTKII